MKTASERIDDFLARQTNSANILAEQNDRAAAVRTSALIEETLTFILQLYFNATPANEKRGDVQTGHLLARLFENFWPLSTFAGKILLFDALGLLSASARHDLHQIKKIRNSFAHEPTLLEFSSPSIAQKCDSLMLWKSAQVIIDGFNWPLTHKVKYVLSGIVVMLELAQAAKANLELFKLIEPMGEGTFQNIFGDLPITRKLQ
jgi:hypothetical protein